MKYQFDRNSSATSAISIFKPNARFSLHVSQISQWSSIPAFDRRENTLWLGKEKSAAPPQRRPKIPPFFLFAVSRIFVHFGMLQKQLRFLVFFFFTSKYGTLFRKHDQKYTTFEIARLVDQRGQLLAEVAIIITCNESVQRGYWFLEVYYIYYIYYI